MYKDRDTLVCLETCLSKPRKQRCSTIYLFLFPVYSGAKRRTSSHTLRGSLMFPAIISVLYCAASKTDLSSRSCGHDAIHSVSAHKKNSLPVSARLCTAMTYQGREMALAAVKLMAQTIQGHPFYFLIVAVSTMYSLKIASKSIIR